MTPQQYLVFDKKGIIGEAICEKLALKSLTVFVSQKQPKLDEVVIVPYNNGSPSIPGYTYSHIFVVDDGTIATVYLDEFLEKAKKDNAGLTFITNLADASSFYKKIKGSLGWAKIIIVGDIIGNNTYPMIICNAIKFGKIVLENEGLSKTYPVFLDDVAKGIIATEEDNSATSIFYLFPKHPPTELSLAQMIQKANPMVQIDFAKNPKKEQELKISLHGKYLLPDNYPLKKKIRDLNMESLVEGSHTTNFGERDSSTPIKSGLGMTVGMKLFLVLFVLFIMPFVLTLALSLLGFVTLGHTKTAIEKGDMANAQKSAFIAKTFFSLAKKSSTLLLAEGKLVGQEKNIENTVIKNISLGYELSQMVISITDGSKVLSEVFAGRSINPQSDFAKGVKDLKNAITIFRQIEARGELPSDVRVKIKSVDNLIKIAESIIDHTPNLFGINGKKVYLVLFQNNMELRPGGGFIGSYGLLTLNAGKIASFSIADVYDADGQLKGHVEPPFAIRRYLKIPHLYLRDSNFDVDFAKGASSSAILLNAELGEIVNGVLGIDVSFVRSILEAVGHMYVAEYKETVTSANLYELTQSHAEKNFFPGSRQKKDFLRSLFSAMQSKLSSNDSVSYLEIAKSIDEAISQKHLLFAFSDKNMQDVFTINKWSSSLEGSPDISSKSINDFLGINEANLGVNKANYFVKRNVSHNVRIKENGSITGEVNIDFQNSSNKWPGGDYINYLRIILPLNTTIH